MLIEYESLAKPKTIGRVVVGRAVTGLVNNVLSIGLGTAFKSTHRFNN
jgi:hypothetical protein